MTTIQNILAFCVCVLATSWGYSSPIVARGLLHADGIVEVRGGHADRSLVTVIPADSDPYTLEQGTNKFVLELRLNNKYMVRFECPEHVTKELYFDTTVPDEFRLDEYQFPFKVELEPVRPNEIREYAGPVGYIRYMDLVNDFDYETDYTMKIDRRIEEKLDLESPSITTAGDMDDTPGLATANSASGIPLTDSSREEAEVEVEVGPLEPVDIDMDTAMNERPLPVRAETVAAPVTSLEENEEPMPDVAPAVAPVSTAAPAAEGRTAMPLRYTNTDEGTAGREEELIVDDRKVTTIVRIVDERGFGHEYRRVAHKFGPVFYFMDDQSIPEHMYYDHTGMPME